MLPFTTLHEAELGLGKTLTITEELWFNYSARKSDFLLHCHAIPLLFLIFSFAPLPFLLVELMNLRSLEKYKIQPKVKLSSAELWQCYKDVAPLFIYVVSPLQMASYPFIKMIGIRMDLVLPTWREICMQLLVYALIEDYGHYWIHRFLHGKWGYENIHHVHHEYTAPTAFATTNYTHWAEVGILGIPSHLGPAIVPGHILTFWLWLSLRQLSAFDTHSGYDFPWSLTKCIPSYGGPEHHDYHHFVGGQSQSNFASMFTYCDYIYGTDKGYQYYKTVKAKAKGLRNGEQPDNHSFTSPKSD